MTLCLQCGAIMHREDATKHICDAANIPIKGKEKQPTTTEKTI
jgi:hypothetical protein